jgi:acyl-coenzyme A thioesterase PaaI-like protein
LVTIGDMVHGGAISALVDTAAMAAPWSAIEFDGTPPLGDDRRPPSTSSRAR